MKKLTMVISLLCCIFVFGAASVEAETLTHDFKINISGETDSEFAGRELLLMIKNLSTGDIAYIDQTTVDGNGKYSFLGRMKPGDVSELQVTVNYNRENLNDTIREATAFSELFDISLKVADNAVVGQAIAEIKSLWGINRNSYDFSLILGFYSSDGNLLGVKMSDFDKISLEKEVETKLVTENIPEGSAYMKAFAFKNLLVLTPYTEAAEEEVGKSISCWGDSLTFGTGGSTFFSEVVADADKEHFYSLKPYSKTEYYYSATWPKFLEKSSGKTVYNFGVPGAGPKSISRDQGAYPTYTAEDFILSARAGEKSVVGLEYGKSFAYDMKCEINGIEVFCESLRTYNDTKTKSYFEITRTEDAPDGEVVYVEAGTEVVPFTKNTRNDDINVIWMGTNGLPSSGALIEDIYAMIANMKNDNYIILGVIKYPDYECEQALAEKYGEKFIPLRSYFCKKIVVNGMTTTQAFIDYGITPTAADLIRIEKELLPKSFCNTTDTNDSRIGVDAGDTYNFDTTHFNARGYKLIADLVYDRMVELGYLVREDSAR